MPSRQGNASRPGKARGRAAPARRAAYDILLAVGAGRADLASAIAHARATLDDPRDRALAADIAVGVERWRAALDHVIAYAARRPLEKLDDEVVTILRLSAYQLLNLTRVPAAAVVDDGVDLTRRAGKQSAAGLVNAVLRSIARTRHRLPLPQRPDSGAPRNATLDYLSVTLSHPRWLADRWLDRYGFDAAERWMQFNNTQAPLTLRTNTRVMDNATLIARLARAGVAVTPGRFAPHALVVESGQPLQTDGLDAGWFVVQDEASQLITLLAGETPGSRVLDACASPGNKTTAVAAATSGLVVACDVRDRRMALLARTVHRARAANVRLVQADLGRPLPFGAVFDTVIADVPCSGLGTLRRDPDIRWRRHPDDLPRLATAALGILRHAATGVAPGGRLVYATCSSEPEENDAVVAAFLASDPSFTRLDARRAHAALPAAIIDEDGYLRTRPDRHALEAFFGAVFVRDSRT